MTTAYRLLAALLTTALIAAVVSLRDGSANAQGRLFPRLFARRSAPAEPRFLPMQPPPPIPTRNMVNLVERNLPTSWSVEEGNFKNIKWSAKLGSHTFPSPVVADGKVFIGTNNGNPRDPNVMGHKHAVLMAFGEADGTFLWQITHAIPDDEVFSAIRFQGLVSTPAVDERRLYYLTPACEVICAACADGAILWRYDMIKELKVVPYYFCQGTQICSPLVVGDLVFVVTGNGTDGYDHVIAPKAPSFVALHKKTGQLVWQSNLPGANIIEGQYSSPTFAMVNNVPQVIFAGGDGVIYSFVPETGKLLWSCDCLPTRKKKGERGMDQYFVAAPVVVGDRLYIGLGNHPDNYHPSRSSWFFCLDITKSGDVSLKSYDAKAPANKDSALIWALGGPIVPTPAKGPRAYFNKTVSTAAVHDGLVYISEENGYLHCLDADTGQRYWVHDVKAVVYGSPYWADGKVYLGTDDELRILAHGKTEKLIAAIDMDDSIHNTPVAARGVLFVATRTRLYAIGPR